MRFAYALGWTMVGSEKIQVRKMLDAKRAAQGAGAFCKLTQIALDEVYRFFFSYFSSKGNRHFRILPPNFGNEGFNRILHKFFTVNFVSCCFHDYFMVFFAAFIYFEHKHRLTINRCAFNQCFVRQNITIDAVVFPVTPNDETIIIRVLRIYLERSFPLKSAFMISRSCI